MPKSEKPSVEWEGPKTKTYSRGRRKNSHTTKRREKLRTVQGICRGRETEFSETQACPTGRQKGRTRAQGPSGQNIR